MPEDLNSSPSYTLETPVFFFANGPVSGDKELEALTLRMFQSDQTICRLESCPAIQWWTWWPQVVSRQECQRQWKVDLTTVDTSEAAMQKLAKSLASTLGITVKPWCFSFMRKNAALELHAVTIEGPLKTIQSPAQKEQQAKTKEFLGPLADDNAIDREDLTEQLKPSIEAT